MRDAIAVRGIGAVMLHRFRSEDQGASVLDAGACNGAGVG
jgi:hypothetical protein